MEHTIILNKEEYRKRNGKRRNLAWIRCLLLSAAISAALNFGLCQWTDLYARSSDLELVFLLDKSISMAGEPLENAADCIWQSIYRLRDQTPISLVTFSDSPEESLPLTCQYEAIFQVLHEVKAGGVTDISAGLREAERILSSGNPESVREIVLLTDGRNGAERILPEISKGLKEKGIRVYIVGILGDENPALERLAKDTGGEFVRMGEELARVLRSVCYRQESRRIRIFLAEGAAETIFLSMILHVAFGRLNRRRRKTLPNAGYMSQGDIADVLQRRR